jgi:hypothetical protein
VSGLQPPRARGFYSLPALPGGVGAEAPRLPLTSTPPRPPAAPGAYYYNSTRTNCTYLLNTTAATFAAANAACNRAGGHLVSFTSFVEQQDVELHFTNRGALIPTGHRAYWIGLLATNATTNATSWPTFRWLDSAAPVPVEATWGHWAAGEPNRAWEICALANYSASFGFTWGWQDANCNRWLPSICKLASGWRCPAAAGPCAPAGQFDAWNRQRNAATTHAPPTAPPLAAEPRAYATYSDPATKVRYTLFTQPANFAGASARCRALGGNLVSYTSAAEQLAVERALVLQGTLIPAFHQRYWLGLAVVPPDPEAWGNFTWLDGSLQPDMVFPFLVFGGYSNWWVAPPPPPPQPPPPGSDVPPEDPAPQAPDLSSPPPPAGPQSEPNNHDPPELCAAASYAQATNGGAWGWGDANCGLAMPFVCKVLPPPPPLLRLPPSPPPRPPPSPVLPTYTSPTSRTVYVFNSTPADYWGAADACAAAGGYLVTYPSATKQLEVERALAQQNALLGASTPFYWMGLRVDNEQFYWPFFSWMMNGSSAAVLTARSYTHWGTDRGDAGREPNNVCPPEDCAGANFTQVRARRSRRERLTCAPHLPAAHGADPAPALPRRPTTAPGAGPTPPATSCSPSSARCRCSGRRRRPRRRPSRACSSATATAAPAASPGARATCWTPPPGASRRRRPAARRWAPRWPPTSRRRSRPRWRLRTCGRAGSGRQVGRRGGAPPPPLEGAAAALWRRPAAAAGRGQAPEQWAIAPSPGAGCAALWRKSARRTPPPCRRRLLLAGPARAHRVAALPAAGAPRQRLHALGHRAAQRQDGAQQPARPGALRRRQQQRGLQRRLGLVRRAVQPARPVHVQDAWVAPAALDCSAASGHCAAAPAHAGQPACSES